MKRIDVPSFGDRTRDLGLLSVHCLILALLGGMASGQEQAQNSARVIGSLELPEGLDRDAVSFWPQRPDLLMAQTLEGVVITSIAHATQSSTISSKSLLRGEGPAIPSFGKWVRVAAAPGERDIPDAKSAAGFLFGMDSHRLYLEDARGRVTEWDLLNQREEVEAFFRGNASTKSLTVAAQPPTGNRGSKALEVRPRTRLELRGRGSRGRIVQAGASGEALAVLFDAAKAGVPVFGFQVEPAGARFLIDSGEGEFSLFDPATGSHQRLPTLDISPLGVSQWKWISSGNLIGVVHEVEETGPVKGDPDAVAGQTEEPVLANSRLVRYSASGKSLTPFTFEGNAPAKAFSLLAASEDYALVEPIEAARDREAEKPGNTENTGLVIAIGAGQPAAVKGISPEPSPKAPGLPVAEDAIIPFGVSGGF